MKMKILSYLLIFSFLNQNNIFADIFDDCIDCNCPLVDSDEAEAQAIQEEKNINETNNNNNSNNSKEKKPANQLRMSDEGLKKLAAREGFRGKIYNDQNGKKINNYVKGATIGYGHLIKTPQEYEKYKNGISKEEALKLYRQDLTRYEKSVRKTIKTNVTQNQFDAMVSLTYNIGTGGFEKSSVAKLVNNPNAKTRYKDLNSAWMAFNKSQGKVMKGLVNRRKSELEQFNK